MNEKNVRGGENRELCFRWNIAPWARPFLLHLWEPFMGTLEDSPLPAELAEELRPLHKREVLWALSIILALTVAPAVSDIYDAYCM